MSSSTGARAACSDLASRTGVIVITYNHEEYIEDCLETVLANDPGEVVVVDSGSTDDTVETVQAEFPGTRVIRTEENMGYGGASNRGVREVGTEFVVVLNPDTRIEPSFIDGLLEPVMEEGSRITTPKILTYDGERINTVGNVVHFSGLAFTRGYGEPPDAYSEPGPLSGISGACFATTRETYRELGGFDESIFIYMEDVELSWKANVSGVEIHYVPGAVVFHDYPGIEVDAAKLFHLERGRYIILRKYLGWRTAALLLPSLLVAEVLTWGFAAGRGPAGLKAKARAVFEGFTTSVEAAEADTDTLLGRLDSRIPVDELEPSRVVGTAIRFANRLFEANVSLVES
jgi:GT2 family glycosyltransferase